PLLFGPDKQVVHYSEVEKLVTPIQVGFKSLKDALIPGLIRTKQWSSGLNNTSLLGKPLPIVGSSIGRAANGVETSRVGSIEEENDEAFPEAAPSFVSAAGPFSAAAAAE